MTDEKNEKNDKNEKIDTTTRFGKGEVKSILSQVSEKHPEMKSADMPASKAIALVATETGKTLQPIHIYGWRKQFNPKKGKPGRPPKKTNVNAQNVTITSMDKATELAMLRVENKRLRAMLDAAMATH